MAGDRKDFLKNTDTIKSFKFIFLAIIMAGLPSQGSGGRAPSHHDNLARPKDQWNPGPPASSEARLTIIQITDVYTLANFASLKTMIAETRKKSKNSKVISILTGDFLAPYLLSSVDRGAGMMNAIAKTPIDYVQFGNHEADIDHRTVCKHVENFPGTWLNTNMQDHEAMGHMKACEIIEISSPDGTHKKRIGLIAVLSNAPALYAHHKPPGAFGGAKIRDPWETLDEYKRMLEGPKYKCDLVIPLQHLYVPDDHITCRNFDFPVILSGHDHHRVDEVVDGTRLLKPGLDAIYATVLDISWDAKDIEPTIKARFVKVGDWKRDQDLHLQNLRAYDALLPLRNTELARVPPSFLPLSSVNSRGCVTSMGRLICSLIRSSLNATNGQNRGTNEVDAVVLMGGNIRGGTEYPKGSFFSLEALEAEIKGDEVVAIVPMPGSVLSDGICATHAGDPRPGWMQYDCGIEKDGPGGPVKLVSGKPIEKDRIYRVATKISDLTNGQSQPFTKYYKAHPELLPPKGAYINIHAELMGYFARNVWFKIWNGIKPNISSTGCNARERLGKLDLNKDGVVAVNEIHAALRDIVGLSVHDDEKSLAKFVHSFADISGDGKVTLEDFEIFCKKMSLMHESGTMGRISSSSTNGCTGLINLEELI